VTGFKHKQSKKSVRITVELFVRLGIGRYLLGLRVILELGVLGSWSVQKKFATAAAVAETTCLLINRERKLCRFEKQIEEKGGGRRTSGS
jgi:hypothetical protein